MNYCNIKCIQEYLPRTRIGAGVGSLPGGQLYYQAVLRWYLSADVPAQNLHELGLESVNSLQARMNEVSADQTT